MLCGRATWKDGIAIYGKQGGEAFRTWLESEGVKNIQNVNDHLKPAHPWYEFYGAKSADAARLEFQNRWRVLSANSPTWCSCRKHVYGRRHCAPSGAAPFAATRDRF